MIMPSRRKFLKTGASVMALAAAYAAGLMPNNLITPAQAQEATPKGREYIMTCHSPAERYTHKELSLTQKSRPSFVNVLDVAANETAYIDIPFLGHIINQHAVNPAYVMTFEKWGHKSAMVDVKNKKIVTMMESSKDHEFFGHMHFNEDGSHFANSEYSAHHPVGRLAIRDSSTMKMMDAYSSYGAWPHDIFSPDNGKTLIVANGGHGDSQSNISWVDFASGKLKHQLVMEAGHYVDYQHVTMSHDGWMCIAGKTKVKNSIKLIQFVSPDGEVYSPDIPKDLMVRMTDETLSMTLLEKSDLLAITIPKSNVVLVINYKTQKLVEALIVDFPKGVLPTLDPADDNNGLLVSLGKEKELVSTKIQYDQKPPVTHLVKDRFGGAGSHITRIYI
ncbi:MAG: DUF1513 domain-containing protein [Alphaproteobacteria bacterium]|nr:DUF1513 domain-containing protein [Alphaproteobacteria bacterium]